MKRFITNLLKSKSINNKGRSVKLTVHGLEERRLMTFGVSLLGVSQTLIAPVSSSIAQTQVILQQAPVESAASVLQPTTASRWDDPAALEPQPVTGFWDNTTKLEVLPPLEIKPAGSDQGQRDLEAQDINDPQHDAGYIAINNKFKEMGGDAFFGEPFLWVYVVGGPAPPEPGKAYPMPDGVGRAVDFQNGSIYWSPGTGAHFVGGPIRDKWWQQYGVNGDYGYPTTDEIVLDSGVHKSYFRTLGADAWRTPWTGAVVWTERTGAHAIRGDIGAKWNALGGDLWGVPLAEERTAKVEGSVMPGDNDWYFQWQDFLDLRTGNLWEITAADGRGTQVHFLRSLGPSSVATQGFAGSEIDTSSFLEVDLTALMQSYNTLESAPMTDADLAAMDANADLEVPNLANDNIAEPSADASATDEAVAPADGPAVDSGTTEIPSVDAPPSDTVIVETPIEASIDTSVAVAGDGSETMSAPTDAAVLIPEETIDPASSVGDMESAPTTDFAAAVDPSADVLRSAV